MNLAQLVMVGVPADGDLSAVAELQPGGIILMGRNAAPAAELRRWTREAQACLQEEALIAVDQEGGRVQRFKHDFTLIPPAAEVGARGARQVGLTAMNTAAELRGAGVNLNFAPVCDIPVHPEDSVIGNRAYATDFFRGATLVAEYIRGAQPTVGCCAKHFPGHGGVGVDSHHALPTFPGSREDLAPHLVPFRSAIAAGVTAIMAGHIAVPQVDPSGAPASLSYPLITGLLREEMGFRGLVVTDDLEMGALGGLESGEIAVRALQAGCDLLLFCHSTQKAKAAIRGIEDALQTGELTIDRVEDALARIAWAKSRCGLNRER